MLIGNAVIGQSGGPTSVINASLVGAVKSAGESECIERIFGMKFGIEGFMQGEMYDLSAQPDSVIEGLQHTPSSALGSSRHKLVSEDFPRIKAVLEKYNIRYLFLIGGNDTMDTIHRIEAYCQDVGYELHGIGIPKTVDNDLYGTDHTPGFASAARSNILSVKEAGILARDMQKVDQFVIYQTIGRDAGWLAAATALAKNDPSDAPHLIYCPERAFNVENFIEDAKQCVKLYGWVSVVVSEGLLYEDGTPVSASQSIDKFNNTEFGAMGGASVAINIHAILREALGKARGEFQITESLVMCAIDRAESADLEEAYQCGQEAVQLAVQGISGYMVSIERVSSNPVKFQFGKTPLEEVAVRAKTLPENYITERGNFVTAEFIDYMKPLISELPEFTTLKDIYVRIIQD
ncbi:MAG: diphosphate--fructose-6-phosphate 1-phosphotransferase [Bacteroidetes bacterium]|nr:diphosphate--fructose-6-phosphate 1-phosphotransferase [Bacteroidota bacterium]